MIFDKIKRINLCPFNSLIAILALFMYFYIHSYLNQASIEYETKKSIIFTPGDCMQKNTQLALEKNYEIHLYKQDNNALAHVITVDSNGILHDDSTIEFAIYDFNNKELKDYIKKFGLKLLYKAKIENEKVKRLYTRSNDFYSTEMYYDRYLKNYYDLYKKDKNKN